RRAGTAAWLAGRAGVAAMGAGHARAGHGSLVQPPAAPGRPPGPGRVERRRRPLRAGDCERGDGRCGAGQASSPPPGWLAAGCPWLSLSATALAAGYAAYGLLARPGALPAARYAALYDDTSFIVWPACIGFVLLLTPTGSLPSRRWKWWARIAAVSPVLALRAAGFRAAPWKPP